MEAPIGKGGCEYFGESDKEFRESKLDHSLSSNEVGLDGSSFVSSMDGDSGDCARYAEILLV